MALRPALRPDSLREVQQKIFVSYGQFHEDVLLARLFGEDRGTYIDVGACHPVEFSVTNAFYQRGWRGINIEPQADMYELLCTERPEDINLNIAVSNEESTRTLYSSPSCIPGATLHTDVAGHIRSLGGRIRQSEVRTRTLRSVLEEHLPDSDSVDFLKVDVEGHEREVLEGMSWDDVRPRVVVVEALRPHMLESSHEGWEHILVEAGYVCAGFDGGNRYYASAEDQAARRAFALPICRFDEYVDYEQIQTIAWIAQNLNRRLDEMPRSHELVSLGHLLERMVASPGMLKLRPAQLSRLLSELIANSSLER